MFSHCIADRKIYRAPQNQWGQFMGKISGENQWGKSARKISADNQWGGKATQQKSRREIAAAK